MITAEDLKAINAFMETRRLAILRTQEAKGLKASGLSARLLYNRSHDNVFDLVDGAGYFEFQEFGRRPGGAPPYRKIYDWLQYKKYGLNWTTEKQRVSMAWAILKKIRKQGTYTNRMGRQTGVLSETIQKPGLDKLIAEIAEARATQILTDIKRILV